MANDYFQFKKFLVKQEKCSMKVGTDGVLLGAWVDLNNTKNILDVGCGTGLISLMMAQRQEQSHIDAVEINSSSASQALENINDSLYQGKINVHEIDYLSFRPKKKYDLIVSNPPFFIAGTPSPNEGRKIARHAISLSYKDFIEHSCSMLDDNGRIALIAPTSSAEEIYNIGKENGLNVSKACTVFPNKTKPSKRTLIEFTLHDMETEKQTIVLEQERHQYTDEAKKLFKEFYLNL